MEIRSQRGVESPILWGSKGNQKPGQIQLDMACLLKRFLSTSHPKLQIQIYKGIQHQYQPDLEKIASVSDFLRCQSEIISQLLLLDHIKAREIA